MGCHLLSRALALGTLALVWATPAGAARADSPPPPAPKTRTITVTDCVEEKVQEKRTCYRVECRTVEVDTFRCETVCEARERLCTVVKRIPVHSVETRKVCCPTWTWEERVVMKPCWEYKQVTTCVKKCVSRGHWECRTECAKPGIFDRLCKNGHCGPERCGHDRRNACDDHCRVRTKKVWVHCPVYVSCPVTKCVKVCVHKPTVSRVRVCHNVCKDVQVTVCNYRCVEEQVKQTYHVHSVRKVPVKATRVERVCVPYEETVWVTRLVPRQREVQVVETSCSVPCCPPCPERCPRSCGGLRFRQHGCCH